MPFLSFFAAALLSQTTPTPKAGLSSPIVVPIKLVDEAIIVDTVVNGCKASLLFDTGFGGAVVLSPTLSVGPVTGKVTLRDFVGELTLNTVKMKSFQIGDFKADPAQMEIVQQEMGLSANYGIHCDGILGLELLKKNVLEINFEKRQMIFHPTSYDISKLPVDGKTTFLAKMLPTGLNAVDLIVNTSGGDMALSLDTGNAFYATTHTDVLERLGFVKPGNQPKFMGTSGVASGAVDAYEFRLKDLTIFGVPVKSSVWNIIHAPAGTAGHDGTVGYQFLKNFNITFDLARRRVYFQNFSGKVDSEESGDLGIYAAYSASRKAVMIFKVAPDSPAAKAGIKDGDFLLTVNDLDLQREGFKTLRRLIKGPEGSEVKLVVNASGVLKRLTLKREKLIN